jgi:hypothetical protein
MSGTVAPMAPPASSSLWRPAPALRIAASVTGVLAVASVPGGAVVPAGATVARVAAVTWMVEGTAVSRTGSLSRVSGLRVAAVRSARGAASAA